MTIETQSYSSKLPRINDLLDTLKIETNEDGYREKLSKLDSNDLEQLVKLDKNELKILLEKPQLEIKQHLIQAQIKKIEDSDNPNFDKLDELQNKLIALEKAETQTEINETNNNNDIIKTNTKQIKEQLTSIKGSFL